MQEFIKYFDTIKSHDLRKITEHTLRPALNELLVTIAKELNPQIKIIHEHKREGKFGAPDFKVFETENIIGYIENKKIDETLDKILKSDQIKKYKELSNNLLLTNYLEWIWIRTGEIQQRETLCFISDLEIQKSELNLAKAQIIKTLINNYLSTAPQGISEPEKLAESLALRAKLLKDFIFEELQRQEQTENQPKLKGLYHTFKDFVFSDLTVSEFADAFAQTLVYGLFLAKLNADTKQVNLYNVSQFIPTSFQLIRELVDFLKELENPDYKEIRWIVEEVITIMNTLDLRAIQESLSFSNRKKSEIAIKDPYVYFYENFLAAYDKNLRKAKGVYYTPPPVVNFIVKSTNEILKTDFNIKNGLADEKQVTILDFATGTGTFLIEIFQNIFETISNSGKRDLIIQEHLLKNVFGFEYLIAPYTITHLKLSQFLKEHDYQLSEKERFQVFLTNTLEPIDKQIKIPLLPALSQESKGSQEVKDKPILVITGNPPYSVSSSNNSDFIYNLMTKYKIGLNEKNIQSLSDDYIKFIRFAHYKIEKVGQGVIAIITNNSYLTGSIHRKMRETLYNDFDKIYILNLHGNSLRKEAGENVFDIRVGVSILFLIKTTNNKSEKQVYYYSTKENEQNTRNEKFDFLLNNSLLSVEWKNIKPQAPDFWFTKKDLQLNNQYSKYYPVKDIFIKFVSGINTSKDEFITDDNNEILENRISDFFKLNNTQLIENKFGLSNSNNWIENTLKNIRFDKTKIKLYAYKPLINKYIYYEKSMLDRDRFEIMKNMLHASNLSLLLMKTPIGNAFNHVFVTNYLSDANFYGYRTYSFPLYLFEEPNIFKQQITEDEKLYRKEYIRIKRKLDKSLKLLLEATEKNDEKQHLLEELKTITEEQKTILENLKNKESLHNAQNQSTEFVKVANFSFQFKRFITEKYKTEFTPEQILGYIYAILYSPFYRIKYAEFLKTDFPKIPFIDSETMFVKLSEIGCELIDLHTLKKIPDCDYGNFIGKGDYEIKKIVYSDNKLFINQNQYFENTPENVFDFTIGNYKVIERYLKDRKDKKLELEEINTIENTIKSLAFTIKKMNELEILTEQLI
jgi:predicted helicase